MNKPWWMNNGTLKKAAWMAPIIFAAGGAWAKLNAIQRTVNLAATQTSVDELRTNLTDRVERLEGFHFQPTP